MLSVNIPVFNIDAHPLVTALVSQAGKIAADIEIRIYDDGSGAAVREKNRSLAQLPGVVYREMKANMGRAALRNKMGADSFYGHLLFIDADSKVISGSFLETYLRHLPKNPLICGGTAYSRKRPASPGKLLRWVYGSKREALPARQRNSQKGFIITSNNFLIEKELLNRVGFREKLGPYGHEDTMLGYDLFCRGILPRHIENPVEHTGLEDSGTFLEKTRAALENLFFISNELIPDALDFRSQVRFLHQYHKITNAIPVALLRLFHSAFHRMLEKNLTGEHPRLFLFDLYKVGYYSKVTRKGKNRQRGTTRPRGVSQA